MSIEKFEVKNQFSGNVQFTAEISATPDMTPSIKLGLAIRWAVKNDVNLSGADLSGANLNGVNLRGADLRSIEADFRFILSRAHIEAPALIKALKAGNVNGSTYEGDCACLVGTLENAGAVNIPHKSDSPAEVWFAPIKTGDTPDSEGEGGFRSKIALEWAESYCRDTGISLEQVKA